MINKFSSLCHVCKDRIPAGTDVHYDPVAKKISHHACVQNREPLLDNADRLADELGFRKYEWEEIKLKIE